MSPEKWEEIKETAKKNFQVESEEIFELPQEQGGGMKETLIFIGPLGKMKLEYLVKPLVIQQKAIFSNRMGASSTVNYVKSDTEKVRTFLAYKWDEASEDWVKISSSNFE